MGTPTVFPSSFGFGPNYLLNPKPGEKRSFFTTLRGSHHVKNSVPYIIDVLPEFIEKPMEQTFATYFGRYGNKMNFHVPQLKTPSLVGGFIGAKSQSSREDCGKLGDILASAFSQILSNNMTTSEFANNIEMFKQNYSQKTPFCPQESTNSEKIAEMSREVDLESTPVLGFQDGNVTKNHRNAGSAKKMCMGSMQKDEKEKPPMKKPKLNMQTCRPPRGKRKGRRKKCEKNVQCNSPLASPGYDPSQSSFECVDEVDCGIKLFNRFAPLECDSSFSVWSESPKETESSDCHLLDMLSEMHLDDFEVDFDNASSAVDVYDVHSYESDSPLSMNSSIAFILSGNDDVLASDSEDGSFASDLDDVQWQSFKADFEYFQDHIPMQNIVIGSCELRELHFDADLEVFDSDIFLNNLEHQSDNGSAQRLREVNARWNRMAGSERQKPSKVCFAPDNCLTTVLYIPSGPEECQARKSPWDQCYMDRCRFEKKVKELEPIISLCLTPQHRKSVFQRLYGSDELI